MKYYLSTLSLLFHLVIFAQYTLIPDVYFENALIMEGLDDVEDGRVLTSNINSITEIDLWDYSISDLTGIQDFVSLNYLYCEDNLLTSIDVSALPNLYALDCSGNQLTSITANTSIGSIICVENALTEVDFSVYSNLSQLWIDFNQLTTLDLSANHNLDELYCGDNPLSSLNIQNGNNQNLLEFNAVNVEPDICIQVDDASLASAASIAPYNAWEVDATAQFSNDCGTVSVNDLLIQEIEILPSLVNDVIQIRNLEMENFSKITIYDTLGKEVLISKKLNTSVSVLKDAVYFVKISMKNGQFTLSKIVKTSTVL